MDTLWNETNIKELVSLQRGYFNSGVTLPISFRIEMLRKLKQMVINYESDIATALKEDLGRDYVEAYFCDVGSIILEINETLKGIKRWAKPERHYSGMVCFPSFLTKVYKMPYGVSLIISPFNFPFLLSIGVLIASIAGGNTSVIKASSKSVSSTKLLIKMISETFDKKYIAVIDGGHDIADICLAQRFDKIFYTGSPKVAKHVMECASKNLTSVALELGGETGNWCVIRKDADIKDAARKIAFFKACNSGQVCININQIAVASEVAELFIQELKKAFISQLGEKISTNKEYAKLINKGAFDYCISEMNEYKDRIVFGGDYDETSLKISPTIIYPVDINEPIVNHELFNPLLPIVSYPDNEVEKLFDVISSREHGLALYIFTKDKKWATKKMSSMQFGGGCINEVTLHMMVKGAPFNGVGHSGMGAYHGKWGFNEFTHPSTVLYGSTHFNLSIREHPYNKKKLKRLKKYEK